MLSHSAISKESEFTFFYSSGLHRSVSKVHDEWFADEENVRKTVGLLEKHIEMPNKREVCPILTTQVCR
jgi:hypothetical protein